MTMVYKLRPLVCLNCGHSEKQLLWSYEGNPLCECGEPMSLDEALVFGEAPGVIGDECDVWIKHGLCNADGSPKRYTSKEQIRRDAAKKGLVADGDTPHVRE